LAESFGRLSSISGAAEEKAEDGWLHQKYARLMDLPSQRLCSLLVNLDGETFQMNRVRPSSKLDLLKVVEFATGMTGDCRLEGPLRNWEHLLAVTAFLQKQRGCRTRYLQPVVPESWADARGPGVYELVEPDQLMHRFTQASVSVGRCIADLQIVHNHSEKNARVQNTAGVIVVDQCMQLLPLQVVDRAAEAPRPKPEVIAALLQQARERRRSCPSTSTAWSESSSRCSPVSVTSASPGERTSPPTPSPSPSEPRMLLSEFDMAAGSPRPIVDDATDVPPPPPENHGGVS
jgi:hypothetical protein